MEPLVIEPRPELLQSAAPIRGQNKPTTICLICGHVLFKKVSSEHLTVTGLQAPGMVPRGFNSFDPGMIQGWA